VLVRIKDKEGYSVAQFCVDGIVEIDADKINLIMHDNSLQHLKRYSQWQNYDLKTLKIEREFYV